MKGRANKLGLEDLIRQNSRNVAGHFGDETPQEAKKFRICKCAPAEPWVLTKVQKLHFKFIKKTLKRTSPDFVSESSSD